jgi:hypothetical protein
MMTGRRARVAQQWSRWSISELAEEVFDYRSQRGY